MLKKQLEEKDKQLAVEQEDASAVKNRLRELTKVELWCRVGTDVCRTGTMFKTGKLVALLRTCYLSTAERMI